MSMCVNSKSDVTSLDDIIRVDTKRALGLENPLFLTLLDQPVSDECNPDK